jgi:hypothetical protein
MTITQTVDIPADRRLYIDVPSEVPTGRAHIEVKVIPFVKNEEKPEQPLKCLAGVDTSRVDRLVGIASNPENKTYDELRMEGMMEKYGEYLQ